MQTIKNGNRRAILLDCRLREICKAKGITFGELSKRAKVSRKSLELWGKGCGITLDYALRIAQVLELPIEAIWRLRKEK